MALQRRKRRDRLAPALLGGAALLALAVGCTTRGTPRPINAEAAALAAGPVPRGPARPDGGLPIPSLDVPWTPPMVTAGDVEALAHALAGHDQAIVRLGARLSEPARGEQLVRALSPALEHVEPSTGGLHALVADPSRLPLRRATEPGRPRYVSEGLRVDASSLRELAAKVPDAAVLVAVDDAPVDPQAWHALPAHAVGSCEAPLRALAEGQERALAELEPFLDHADAVLAQVYRTELRAALPALREELQPYAVERARVSGEAESAWRAQQCGHAYWTYLEAYRRCEEGKGRCRLGPRVFLVEGARVGAVEPDVFIPPGCADRVEQDYVESLRELGRESARVAVEHLDPAWMALADRLGTLTEVHAALEDVCAPRRRRFAEEDLATARERLADIGAALASDELTDPGAMWVLEPEPFHVPGVGPVQQHARYDAGPGSPAREVVAQARALRSFVLDRARCRGAAGRLPLAALVVDLDRPGGAPFLGYFYEEELFCGELPPLRDPAAEPAAEPEPEAVPDAPPPGPPLEAPAAAVRRRQ